MDEIDEAISLLNQWESRYDIDSFCDFEMEDKGNANYRVIGGKCQKISERSEFL